MQPCACRDCFEIASAGIKVETFESYDVESEDYVPVIVTTYPLCWECEEAGCERAPAPYPDYPTPHESVTFECQRKDAYGS